MDVLVLIFENIGSWLIKRVLCFKSSPIYWFETGQIK